MNHVVLKGKVSSIPKISFIPTELTDLYVCKFVIEVQTDQQNQVADYFECISFENIARSLHKNFSKGSNIIIEGEVRNHRFRDSNNTWHFTQVIMVESVKKTSSSIKRSSETESQEENKMNTLYSIICQNGFLCLDEDDYYNLATENIIE